MPFGGNLLPRNPNLVYCETCNRGYKAIVLNTKQGEGCACIATINGVYGLYGSFTHAMQFGRWRNEVPKTVALGTICDECLFIHRKDINWIEEYLLPQ